MPYLTDYQWQSFAEGTFCYGPRNALTNGVVIQSKSKWHKLDADSGSLVSTICASQIYKT